MLNDHDGGKEWDEIEEETPPENLQRKWIVREYFGKKKVLCGACQKEVPAENMTCLYCGALMVHDTGLLGRILNAIKGLFK